MMDTDKGKIFLTPLREDDAPWLHKWRSDPYIRDGALGYPFPTTIDAERDWIRSFAPRAGIPSDICFAVRDAQEGNILGYSQLRSIDWIARCAEFGIVIGAEECRGKGFGRMVVAAMMGCARNDLHLRRLWLRVVAYNQTAIKLYSAAGFNEEGRLLRHVFRRGEFHDVLIFGHEIDDHPR